MKCVAVQHCTCKDIARMRCVIGITSLVACTLALLLAYAVCRSTAEFKSIEIKLDSLQLANAALLKRFVSLERRSTMDKMQRRFAGTRAQEGVHRKLLFADQAGLQERNGQILRLPRGIEKSEEEQQRNRDKRSTKANGRCVGTSTTCKRGKKGDMGRRGKRGRRGSAGERGLPGLPGVKGDLGPEGPPGRKGEAGLSGLLLPKKASTSIYLEGNGQTETIRFSGDSFVQWNIKHKSNDIEYHHGNIKITTAGLYVIFAQVYSSQKLGNLLSHDIYIDSTMLVTSMQYQWLNRTQIGSTKSKVSPINAIGTNLAMGMSYLNDGQSISTRSNVAGEYSMRKGAAYFGAFKID